MIVTAVGLTDVGLQREHNEDSYLLMDKHGLFVVADGMGGHQAGDVASKMAAETVSSFFDTTQGEGATWPFPFDPQLTLEENRLQSAIMLANRQIFSASVSNRAVQGMGTTVVGMVCEPTGDKVYVAHVGDSRAYRVRSGEILRLTQDHSLVNDYLTMMPDLPKEATDLLPKNVITRALGMQDTVTVDLAREDARVGDLYLLCSDGLCGQVEDEQILEVCRRHREDMTECAKELVQLANDAGGEDNVTVVLVRVMGVPETVELAQTQEFTAVSDEQVAEATARATEPLETEPPEASGAQPEAAEASGDEASEASSAAPPDTDAEGTQETSSADTCADDGDSDRE